MWGMLILWAGISFLGVLFDFLITCVLKYPESVSIYGGSISYGFHLAANPDNYAEILPELALLLPLLLFPDDLIVPIPLKSITEI